MTERQVTKRNAMPEYELQTSRLSKSETTPCIAIFALWVFVVAQPLFTLLSEQSQFFIAHRFSASDFLLFTLFWSILPPAIAVFVLRLIAGLNRPLASLLCLLVLAALVSIFAVQLGNNLSMDTTSTLVLAASIGIVFALLYKASLPLRQLVDFLAIGIILIPAVFLFSVRELLWSPELQAIDSGANATPVVLIVFDELPLASLLEEENKIDVLRFPNFARLASTSTWYSRALSVADSTKIAIPALLTAKLPTPDGPNASYFANSPVNLFTLLEKSHQQSVIEPVTWLCPGSICVQRSEASAKHHYLLMFEDSGIVLAQLLAPKTLRNRLPEIGDRWISFADKNTKKARSVNRVQNRELALKLINNNAPGELTFLHLLMPHSPWTHYPNGQLYVEGELNRTGAKDVEKRWTSDLRAVEIAYQRHMQQLGFVDRYLGELLDELEDKEYWNSTLLIVVADHGVSFNSEDQYRYATPTNLNDILPVPLFIKYPGQEKALNSQVPASITDVLPTILDVLEAKTPTDLEGSTLRKRRNVPRRHRYTASDFFGEFTIHEELPGQLSENSKPHMLKAKLGVGASDFYLFDISSVKGVLGKPSALLAAEAGEQALLNSNIGDLESAILQGNYRPGMLRAELPKEFFSNSTIIAVAVNSAIHAVTQLHPNGGVVFDVVLPPGVFKSSGNKLEVFWSTNELKTWNRFRR